MKLRWKWVKWNFRRTNSISKAKTDRQRESERWRQGTRDAMCLCALCVCEREWVCYIYLKWRRDKDINTYINYKAYNSMRWASKKLQQINGNNKSTWFVYITFSVWRLLFVCVSSAVSPSCIYIVCVVPYLGDWSFGIWHSVCSVFFLFDQWHRFNMVEHRYRTTPNSKISIDVVHWFEHRAEFFG